MCYQIAFEGGTLNMNCCCRESITMTERTITREGQPKDGSSTDGASMSRHKKTNYLSIYKVIGMTCPRR